MIESKGIFMPNTKKIFGFFLLNFALLAAEYRGLSPSLESPRQPSST